MLMEHWREKGSDTFAPPETIIEMMDTGTLSPEASYCCTIEALDEADCMTIFHMHMGYHPYFPQVKS